MFAIRLAKTGQKDKEAFGFTGFHNLFWSVLVSFSPPQLENLHSVMHFYISHVSSQI